MTINQNMWLAPVIGFNNTTLPSGTSFTLSLTTTWLAGSFVASKSGTINKIKFRMNAVTGTLTTSDVAVHIFSNLEGATPGTPNASLASSTTITPAAASGTYIEATGFTLSVTAGLTYWVVFKNAAASAPVNNFSITHGSAFSGSGQGMDGSNNAANAQGHNVMSTTDSGSSWVSRAHSVLPCVRIEYSDGSFDGLVWSTMAPQTTSSVYNTREAGMIFTTPTNSKLRVIGIMGNIQVSGTPTGNPRFRLYEGTTLQGTTASPIGPTGIIQGAGGQMLALYFSTPQILKPNTSYRAVLGETSQSDASANRFQFTNVVVDNTGATLALKPINGTMSFTYFDGSTWTDTATAIPYMGLILDSVTPYQPIGYAIGN